MRLFVRENTTNLSDRELMIRYREGGDKYFVGELFKRYSHLVYGVCLGYFRDKDESKDAVMQIFEKLFEALKNHEVEHFPAWLGFVSRNFCISELRKRKTAENREEDHLRQAVSETGWEALREEEQVKEHQLSGLQDAIRDLKQEQRICIELFYLHEKSYREINQITGYSDKEVKSFIQNGKRNLKILLSGKHENIPFT